MKNFTTTEKALLVNNVKQILSFVRNNVSPFLRERQYLKFNDDPTHKDIMFIIDSGKNAPIEFSRGYNSTEYYLNDDYDTTSIVRERNKRYNFFEAYDVMFALIENWPRLKTTLMEIVKEHKNITTTLHSFTV